MKRGQVTVFIIVGIVVVLFFISLFVIMGTQKPQELIVDAPIEVQSFVDGCLAKAADEAVDEIAASGGSGKQGVLEIRYWSLVGKADIPTIESFEESIADKAEEKLIGCVADFTAFSKTGLKVSATDPQIKVDIGLQIIVFNVDYTVKSNNGDSTSELDTFSQKVASDLGKQINMAEKFVKANNERPKTFCLSCTAELAEEFKTPFAFEQYGTDYLITLGDTLSFSVGYSEEKQVIQALELFHDSPIFHETTPELEALFEKIIVEGKR